MVLRKKTVEDFDFQGKKVFVRVDFNVPLKEDGSIEDDTRIRAALPTIEYILSHGGIPILASHFGRPKGKSDPKYSLRVVAGRLAEIQKHHVLMLSDCVGDVVKQEIGKAKTGDIVLLENLRFHAEEEKNDERFAQALSSLADLYVNDAFGASHRAHASVVGITKYLPAAAGLLVKKEIEAFERILSDPPRPFTAILGGAKVSDKIGVLKNLLPKCDMILVGGGMTYTFLKAMGQSVGKSLVEEDKLTVAMEIMEEAMKLGVSGVLPQDHVIADRFAADANIKTVDGSIPDGWMALDIGEKTRADFAHWIQQSKSIVWNGPMGVFEMEPFRKGTEAVAKAVASFGGLSVVGGGDSVAAIEALGVTDKITHISTGGGASLEMLEGKTLPGIAALNDR